MFLCGILFCAGCMPLVESEQFTPPSPSESSPLPETEVSPSAAPEIEAPATIEELSALLGIHITLPTVLPDGFSLASIGYDGEHEGALQYANGDVTLTFCYSSDPLTVDMQAHTLVLNGFRVYLMGESSAVTCAAWQKGGVRFRIVAEPSLTQNEMTTIVQGMLTAHDNTAHTSVESLEALSDALGYSVSLPAELPEGFALSSLNIYRGDIAELVYLSGEEELTFRKAEGELPVFYDGEPDQTLHCRIYGEEVLFHCTDGTVVYTSVSSGGYAYAVYAQMTLPQAAALTAGFLRADQQHAEQTLTADTGAFVDLLGYTAGVPQTLPEGMTFTGTYVYRGITAVQEYALNDSTAVFCKTLCAIAEQDSDIISEQTILNTKVSVLAQNAAYEWISGEFLYSVRFSTAVTSEQALQCIEAFISANG